MSADAELVQMSATSVVEKLRREEISPIELLDVLERQIAKIDGKVNALPTLCFDRAHKTARALLAKPVAERGNLAGLPIPIKDNTNVAGVRTTHGSPIYANFVPTNSDAVVEHLETDGAIVYAKSNTPEFAAGGNTFNTVFGSTHNPWKLDCSVAGSSGGAAAALASGMAWIAHGSDNAGSCRSPASFCGIVGLRPSLGRIARTSFSKLDRTLPVEGPLARTVEDVALCLDAMSGEHACDPLSLPAPVESFLRAARSGWQPTRVAYSADLGITPVDPEVKAITQKAAERFVEAGVIVEEAHPNLAEAHECYATLRAFDFARESAALLREKRNLLKTEVIWNIETGLQLKIEDIERAERQRLVMMLRTVNFFKKYDLLLTPATIVPPYPVEQRYVRECDGYIFDNYFEWLAIAYAITLVCCPALSLPCGFTSKGLPVGLQMVGASRSEPHLLAGAKRLEDILGLRGSTPVVLQPGV